MKWVAKGYIQDIPFEETPDIRECFTSNMPETNAMIHNALVMNNWWNSSFLTYALYLIILS